MKKYLHSLRRVLISALVFVVAIGCTACDSSKKAEEVSEKQTASTANTSSNEEKSAKKERNNVDNKTEISEKQNEINTDKQGIDIINSFVEKTDTNRYIPSKENDKIKKFYSKSTNKNIKSHSKKSHRDIQQKNSLKKDKPKYDTNNIVAANNKENIKTDKDESTMVKEENNKTSNNTYDNKNQNQIKKDKPKDDNLNVETKKETTKPNENTSDIKKEENNKLSDSKSSNKNDKNKGKKDKYKENNSTKPEKKPETKSIIDITKPATYEVENDIEVDNSEYKKLARKYLSDKTDIKVENGKVYIELKLLGKINEGLEITVNGKKVQYNIIGQTVVNKNKPLTFSQRFKIYDNLKAGTEEKLKENNIVKFEIPDLNAKVEVKIYDEEVKKDIKFTFKLKKETIKKIEQEVSNENPVKSETKQTEVETNYNWIDLNKSKIIDVQYVYYGVINLREGKANDYEFYLDNKKLDYSNVNMEGTVIKFELKDSKEKTITIKKADKAMYIILKIDRSAENEEEVPETTKTNIKEVTLKYSTDKLVESDKNDGSIEGTLDVSIDSDNKDVEFVDEVSGATFSQMPKGLMLKAKKLDNKTWRFYVEGKSEKHNENDNTLINVSFTEKCFKNLDKDTKFIDKSKDIKIIFKDNETINNIPKKPKEEYNFIDKYKSKIMDIENILYVVLTLKDGNINDYEFYLDDSKVNAKKVNSEGTIVKFEIEDLNSHRVSIKKVDKEETITLNK